MGTLEAAMMNGKGIATPGIIFGTVLKTIGGTKKLLYEG